MDETDRILSNPAMDKRLKEISQQIYGGEGYHYHRMIYGNKFFA